MKKLLTVLVCMVVFTAAAWAQELTFEQLAAKMEQKFDEIADLRAVFEAETIESERKVSTKMDVKWVKEQKLTRIDFLYPAVVEGQFFIADAAKQELSVYVPMMNILMVMPVQSAEEFGFSLPISDFEKPFTFEDVEGEIIRTEQTDQGLNYVVKITELDGDWLGTAPAGANPELVVQYVWIDANFIPVRFEYWEGDECLAKLVIPQYEINTGVSVEELLAVPEDATKVTM